MGNGCKPGGAYSNVATSVAIAAPTARIDERVPSSSVFLALFEASNAS